jgi:hypothetical protein
MKERERGMKEREECTRQLGDLVAEGGDGHGRVDDEQPAQHEQTGQTQGNWSNSRKLVEFKETGQIQTQPRHGRVDDEQRPSRQTCARHFQQ